MPNIYIVNETPAPLRLGLLVGPSPAYWNNYVAEGDTFHAGVCSVIYLFEACTVSTGNEYSANDSLSRAGIMAGAVASGTAAVLVGTASVLGSFGGLFGRSAGFGAAGYLWNSAHAAGAASAVSRTGILIKKDLLVGFSDLKFAVRMENGYGIKSLCPAAEVGNLPMTLSERWSKVLMLPRRYQPRFRSELAHLPLMSLPEHTGTQYSNHVNSLRVSGGVVAYIVRVEARREKWHIDEPYGLRESRWGTKTGVTAWCAYQRNPDADPIPGKMKYSRQCMQAQAASASTR
ncbi:hypothetical protein FIBSPDRAFT_887504 [Athelia psychrophila]|uniref:Uncharacterized protein n=1 Tax=Athelia psychrophila TaxID=1759441 RepID=A0A166PHX3_9AGAM|nr:hypothetical protein FIBSPDRAFT_887504 [Fibularhizoctonia sp. CBS 109695]